MRSNCYREARREYRRRVDEWLADPDPEAVPYFLERRSFRAPVDHYLVGTLDIRADVVRVESFAPIDPVARVHWWQLPLVFEGRWVRGDAANVAQIGRPPRQPRWLMWALRAMRFVWG